MITKFYSIFFSIRDLIERLKHINIWRQIYKLAMANQSIIEVNTRKNSHLLSFERLDVNFRWGPANLECN